MSKFGGSNNKKEVPAMTSSSLSDIVFMLLFFFMVTTQMRETENKVQVTIPEASERLTLRGPCGSAEDRAQMRLSDCIVRRFCMGSGKAEKESRRTV